MTRQNGQTGYFALAQDSLARIHRETTIAKTSGTTTLVAAETHQSLSGVDYAFRREGDFWTIIFEGEVQRLRNKRGFELLAFLIRQPWNDIHVVDILEAVDGIAVDVQSGRHIGAGQFRAHGNAGPISDARARQDYRRRLGDLRAEFIEAEGFNDLGRMGSLRAEMERVSAELRRAYGRGGCVRVAGSPIERARINVRNNISNALKLLKRSHVALWRHLNAAVHTGTFCSYRPERPVSWIL